MKKVYVIISVVALMALASCDTYRVCPTYLKGNPQPTQQTKRV